MGELSRSVHVDESVDTVHFVKKKKDCEDAAQTYLEIAYSNLNRIAPNSVTD